jgi:methylmalonyl-CoA mutase, N-terminal domain
VVGVNAFQVQEQIQLEQLKVDPTIEAGQRSRLAALRQRRDQTRAAELTARLESTAKGSENLVPLMVTCVENDVTLGEICHALRRVWGEYQPPVWV